MAHRSRTERSKQENPTQVDRPQQDRSPLLLSSEAGLKLLVFSAGAVLMGLEIAGSRVLAPFFGNSVFVWGSLISVFLVALSLGYFVGGRSADRHPTHVLLSFLCVLVSLLILLLAVLARGLCGALADAGLGERSGPLVAATLLFLPPSVGLGMVSPFAIRLATPSVASVGKIAGTLYAISTVGSIAGTLLTTFVLIPLVGVSAILKGLGLVLLLVSLLTLRHWNRARALVGAAALVLLILVAALWPGSPGIALARFDTVVVDADTPYHHVSVVDSDSSRQLRFDRYVETEIGKSPPYPSLAHYTDYFHLAFVANPAMKRTLFIGAGGGVGPRAFHMQDPQMAIDVVDIDPKVLELARTHFFLDDSPKIKTFAQDGRMFVRRVQGKYDCMVLDAFSAGGRIPFHLVTREFLELCRDKMTMDGVFIMNIDSAIDGPLAGIFHSAYRTLNGVFPNTYVFAMDHRRHDDRDSRNIILLATRRQARIPPEQWAVRAKGQRSNSYVTNDRLQEMVGDLLAHVPAVVGAPVFSDDYAPIETMPF